MRRFFKVFLSILFVVALATSIAACGQIDDKDNDNPTPGQTTTPDNPTPDAPNNPDTPSTPDAPNNPDTPSTPDAPNNPDTPTEHVHVYGEWETVTNPTCIANGERKRTCSCGKSETETISALGHDFETVITTDVEPTCTLKGSKSHHCTRCEEKTEVTDIEPLGHNMQNGTCTRCNAVELTLEYSYNSGSKTYSVIGYSGNGSIAIIPDTYDDGTNGEHSVTSIGDWAFEWCRGLTSITIPNGVTRIGSSAFEGCSGLKSVTIGNGVTSIGGYAFNSCSGLTSITIPDSVKSIDSYAFYGCYKLVEVYNKSSLNIIVGRSDYGYVGYFAKAVYTEEYTSKLSTDEKGYIVYTDGEDKILIGYTGTETELTFPEGITEIYKYAFYTNNKITKVIIPDSVTSIGSGAFYDCRGLTSVTIPDSVTSIGSYAFCNCSGLTSVTIGNSVTSIGDGAFRNCSGLTSVTIGNSVTSIGDEAFRYCYKLVEVYNKSSLNITVGSSDCGYVGYYAKAVYTKEYTSKLSTDENGYIIYTAGRNKILIGYTGTETELTLPEGTTDIYKYAFYRNNKITKVIIPDSVKSIGSSAFEGCSGLSSIYYTGDIAGWCGISGLGIMMSSSRTLYIDGKKVEGELIIPDSVTSIGDYAFAMCSGLTSITIPDSVTSIGRAAFEGCSGLTSITIGNGVKSIGDWAFEGCSGLTSVTIPDSVTSIGDRAFYNCNGLTSVYYTGDIAGWCGISGLGSIMSSSRTLYIDDKKVEGELIIPEGVTSIGAWAFCDCSGLTSITIPDSVTSIGNYAFYNCSGLTSVTIPDSVTSIGGSAFYNCSGLTSVTIGNSVTSIGEKAFYNCYKLVEVYNKSSLKITVGSFGYGYVGSYAKAVYTKEYTSKLSTDENGYIIYTAGRNKILIGYTGTETELTLPEGTTDIYKYAFYRNNKITKVIIPDSVKSIGYAAFRYCSGLTSVTIGNSVTSIEDGAFYGCSGLTSITIPDSVTSIGNSAFSGTAWYDNQPDGVVYAGKVLYEYKGTMPQNTKIVIKNGTKSISSSAFSSCTGLTSIVIPDSVTSIGDDAFYNCSRLTSVTIGNSVTSIGSYAFEYCRGLTSVTIPDSVTSIGFRAFKGCSSLTIYCKATSKPSGWDSDWNPDGCKVVWGVEKN